MAQKIKVNDVDYIWVDAAGTLPTPPSATGDFDVVYHNNSLATRQHENVKVTFTAADTSKVVTWASFGLRAFDVNVGTSVITDSGEAVYFDITGVSATGCTLTPTRLFAGNVSVQPSEVI